MNRRPRVAILGPFLPVEVADSLRLQQNGPGSLPPGTGGTNIVNLVRARLSHGLATDVITLDPSQSTDIRRWEGDLLRLWVVRQRPRHALRDGFLAERRLLHEALRESDADVCHAHWTYEYGMAAVTQKHKPHVVSVHDHAGHILRFAGFKYIVLYIMARYVLGKARVLTAVSPYVAAYIAKAAGRQAKVVSNPLGEMVWSRSAGPMRREPSAPVIVSVASWSRLKNIKKALGAFSELRRAWPQATYQLIGPGLEHGGAAWRWASQHSTEHGVTFNGLLPYTATLDSIRPASVLLHPSLEESFGCPVAEAMALQVPVVACREAQGVSWLLDNGNAGRLVSGYSSMDMCAAITDTITDAGRTSELRDAALGRVKSLCDEDSVLNGYQETYEGAVEAFKCE